jgi:23S rRNA (guanosine2251-2'-O)-methyltransferase
MIKKKRLQPPEKPRRRPPEKESRPPVRRPVPETRSVIFGVLPVLEALRSNSRRIDKIAVAEGSGEHRLSEILRLAREHSVIVNRMPRESFSKYVDPALNTQGVIAFTTPVDYAEAEDIIDSATDETLLLILDGVEDPRNLGAVLRSAECAGVDGIFIPERRAVGLTDTVAKSSAGAIEYVKVAKVANLSRLIEKIKERDIWVVGTSGDAETSYADWDWTRPSAIVLGAEGTGLHRLVAQNCDVLVKIPMYGKIDSLNVSVAAGVILFEARRQRAQREE